MKLDHCNKGMLELLFEKGQAAAEPIPSQTRSVEETLIQMENEITNIRYCLDRRSYH